jgi:parvulin-like peptidyl-prolyl isomerase
LKGGGDLKVTYSQSNISPEEVIKFLALTGQSNNIYFEMIKNKEVVKKAKELGLMVSDGQLQEFADQYRTIRGLFTSDEMLNFLKCNGLTEEDFEAFCEASVLTMALKESLPTEQRIEEYFINNRSEFDLARISIIIVKEETLANDIMIQVTEEDEDFHKLTRKYSIDETTRNYGGYIGGVSRRMLSPEVAAKVFNAKAGDLLGPFEREKLYQLILVEEVMKAELNDDVKEAIKERIFSEWVSQFLKDGIRINL